MKDDTMDNKASLDLGLILGAVENTKMHFEKCGYTFNEATRQSLLADFNHIQNKIIEFAGKYYLEG